MGQDYRAVVETAEEVDLLVETAVQMAIRMEYI